MASSPFEGEPARCGKRLGSWTNTNSAPFSPKDASEGMVSALTLPSLPPSLPPPSKACPEESSKAARAALEGGAKCTETGASGSVMVGGQGEGWRTG